MQPQFLPKSARKNILRKGAIGLKRKIQRPQRKNPASSEKNPAASTKKPKPHGGKSHGLSKKIPRLQKKIRSHGQPLFLNSQVCELYEEKVVRKKCIHPKHFPASGEILAKTFPLNLHRAATARTTAARAATTGHGHSTRAAHVGRALTFSFSFA